MTLPGRPQVPTIDVREAAEAASAAADAVDARAASAGRGRRSSSTSGSATSSSPSGPRARSSTRPPSFLLRFEELPRDRPLHVICASGSRSAAVAAWLLRNGWSDVQDVAGGHGRLAAGRPGGPSRAARARRGRPGLTPCAARAGLAGALGRAPEGAGEPSIRPVQPTWQGARLLSDHRGPWGLLDCAPRPSRGSRAASNDGIAVRLRAGVPILGAPGAAIGG